jgi:PAS domain S-box-containing protein
MINSLFQTAFEDSETGMAFVGLDGKWMRINQSLCDFLGYSNEELRSLTFQAITAPSGWTEHNLPAMRLFSGEIDKYRGGHEFCQKDGCSKRVLLDACFVRAGDEHPACFFIQVQDLQIPNESHQTEEFRILADLGASQREVEKLREGLLTVCAWTKRIRYDGCWMSVDDFLTKCLNLHLTHGISDEAAESLKKGITRDYEG